MFMRRISMKAHTQMVMLPNIHPTPLSIQLDWQALLALQLPLCITVIRTTTITTIKILSTILSPTPMVLWPNNTIESIINIRAHSISLWTSGVIHMPWGSTKNTPSTLGFVGIASRLALRHEMRHDGITMEGAKALTSVSMPRAELAKTTVAILRRPKVSETAGLRTILGLRLV